MNTLKKIIKINPKLIRNKDNYYINIIVTYLLNYYSLHIFYFNISYHNL